MKFSAQSSYLPYLERLAAHAEEDGVLAHVGPHALFS